MRALTVGCLDGGTHTQADFSYTNNNPLDQRNMMEGLQKKIFEKNVLKKDPQC